jgi:hypothetical protein
VKELRKGQEASIKEATLIVHAYTCICSSCGHEASSAENAHRTVMGQAAIENPGLRGCEATFVATASPWEGEHARQSGLKLRPDLPFIQHQL